jgi:hypothetical protein
VSSYGPRHSTAVFLGPSLDVKEGHELLAADYLPPARKGDIYRIMASGVETIVLVDGVFHSTPSVWPREILSALDEGIQVIGGASMGALRAAELDRFGMQGYGTIYEWYRSGVIEGDDEVAVSHAPEDLAFRPLSEALVNIRFTLNRAMEDGVLLQTEAGELLVYARWLYYPERSYRRLLESEIVNGWPEERRRMIRDYFLRCTVNLKRIDAIGVLRYAAGNGRVRLESNAVASSSEGLWQLERSRLTGFITREKAVTGDEVLEAARKDQDLMASMRRKLTRRCFVLEWARRHDIRAEEDFLAEYIRQWDDRYNIDAAGNWLRANGLTRGCYTKLLNERALVDWIVANGPDYFHLDWDFEGGLRREYRLRRIIAAPEIPGSTNIGTPLPDPDQNGASAQVRIELSYRVFLLEWARENGVACPRRFLQRHREDWERNCFETGGLSVDERDALIEAAALDDWMTAAGPNHFGILWAFEDVLLKELQVTGRAAGLIREGNHS